MVAAFTRHECSRWHCVAKIFRSNVPELSTFTAMKLLFYVDPWVFLQQTAIEVGFVKALITHRHYGNAAMRTLAYLTWHYICLLVGTNAFLVKFRHTALEYIIKQEMGVTD